MKYKPSSKSLKIIERDRRVISSSLTREYELVVDKTKGCYVWDADGRKYLDFSAGVAVANIHTTICAAHRKDIEDAVNILGEFLKNFH